MVGDFTQLSDQGALIVTGLRIMALCLLAPLVSEARVAMSDAAFELEMRPAWQGYTKPGLKSEVQLRLLVSHGGTGRVNLRGPRALVRTDIAFEPGVPLVLTMPFYQRQTTPARVEVISAGELRLSRSIPVTQLPAATRIFAVVDSAGHFDWPAGDVLRDSDKLLHLEVGELPDLADSYDILDTLAIAVEDVQSLTSTQSRALDAFLGRCGRIILAGADNRAIDTLKSRAGCGARNVAAIGATPATAWPKTLPGSTAAVPALRELIGFADRSNLRALFVFVTAYLGLLLLVSRLVRSPLPLLFLPPVAAMLAATGWLLGAPQIRSVSWAEMDSGDPVLRYSGLLQIDGMSRSEQRLPLYPAWGIPAIGDSEQPLDLRYQPREGRAELQLRTLLLSRHELMLGGVAIGPDLALLEDEHRLQVINQSDRISPAGTVAWHGNAYRLPSLAAGQVWQVPDKPDPWGHTASQQMLHERAVDGSTWLLLPYQIPELTVLSNTGGSKGWLVIRGGDGA